MVRRGTCGKLATGTVIGKAAIGIRWRAAFTCQRWRRTCGMRARVMPWGRHWRQGAAHLHGEHSLSHQGRGQMLHS